MTDLFARIFYYCLRFRGIYRLTSEILYILIFLIQISIAVHNYGCFAREENKICYINT